MICQIKGGGEWRAKSLSPTSCFLLPHFVLTSSSFFLFFSVSIFAAKLIFLLLFCLYFFCKIVLSARGGLIVVGR
jgi:hypothetical protein